MAWSDISVINAQGGHPLGNGDNGMVAGAEEAWRNPRLTWGAIISSHVFFCAFGKVLLVPL